MNFYRITKGIIRDFCEDAIRSGRIPTDCEIERCIGEYADINSNDEDVEIEQH